MSTPPARVGGVGGRWIRAARARSLPAPPGGHAGQLPSHRTARLRPAGGGAHGAHCHACS